MPPKRKAAQIEEDDSKEKATPFEDVVFFLASKLSKAKATVTKDVKEAGGSVATSFTKKVTHVVGTQEEFEEGNAHFDKANDAGLPIVSEEYIYDCIKKGKKLPESDYKLKGEEKKKSSKSEKEEKEEEEDEAVDEKEVKTVTIEKKGRAAVDSHCTLKSTCHVIEEGANVYDAMLNQTDISYGVRGHNKFYVAQALEDDSGKGWYCWTRWGRVGVAGQNKLQHCGSRAAAIAEFKKKFKEKTSNNWDNRKNFQHVDGKYDLIEIDYGEEEKEEEEVESKVKAKRAKREKGEEETVPESKLDKRVKDLLSILFDMKMFTQTLVSFDIDIKKMPLGKISKNQIQKGYAVLEEIEELLKEGKGGQKLKDLCSKFYTIIPHDFGHKLPPVIGDLESLQKKMDLLEVLGDIEVAQKMIEDQKKQEVDPFDAKYTSLKNEVLPLDKESNEYSYVQNFLTNTMQDYKLSLLDVFSLDRQGESDLFKKFDEIEHRKMLWHGTNVAVVPAILATGLRIMPHSGGRVGRGLYFADVIAKSASYCGLHNNVGFIFLNEVALGKIHTISKDDPSLRKAPDGYNSILATGSIHPDPSKEILHKTISKSGHPVVWPQGKVVNSSVKQTSFLHNEYLVYDQEQVTLKYLCMIRWN